MTWLDSRDTISDTKEVWALTKQAKRLESWETATEAPLEQVEAALKACKFKKISDGPHQVWHHPLLQEGLRLFKQKFSQYGPHGAITVIIAHPGNKVKGYSLRKILETIEVIDELKVFLENHPELQKGRT